LGLEVQVGHGMGLDIGPSYKPWGGFIITSLLKRICP